jgi:hypothetical protein
VILQDRTPSYFQWVVKDEYSKEKTSKIKDSDPRIQKFDISERKVINGIQTKVYIFGWSVKRNLLKGVNCMIEVRIKFKPLLIIKDTSPLAI